MICHVIWCDMLSEDMMKIHIRKPSYLFKVIWYCEISPLYTWPNRFYPKYIISMCSAFCVAYFAATCTSVAVRYYYLKNFYVIYPFATRFSDIIWKEKSSPELKLLLEFSFHRITGAWPKRTWSACNI